MIDRVTESYGVDLSAGHIQYLMYLTYKNAMFNTCTYENAKKIMREELI